MMINPYLELERQSLLEKLLLPSCCCCFRGESCTGSFATRSNTSDSGSGGTFAGDDATVSSRI
jgi:hypothetical protein